MITTLNNQDIDFIHKKGIKESSVFTQIERIVKGFPNIKIIKPATINDGILIVDAETRNEYIKKYEEGSRQKKIVKFVPASGAATRMFKTLYNIINTYTDLTKEFQKRSFGEDNNSFLYLYQNIQKLAFFNELENIFNKYGKSVNDTINNEDILFLIRAIIESHGLGYGNMPKGLIKFHKTKKGIRTPVAEHLIEGATYAYSGDNVFIHFTVSPQHIHLFKNHISEISPVYSKKYNKEFIIDYSIQSPSTDTITVDKNNRIVRDSNGNLLFRPGGHGALIYNLNSIDADIVFIKNIDNVVQDRLKHETVTYKKTLAGILLSVQSSAKHYYKILQTDNSDKTIKDVTAFLRNELSFLVPENFKYLDRNKKTEYLNRILNRPFRVCGMVKNEGEPGGGPYWVENRDGSVSLQIVEASQFTESQKHIMENATHFNPVDIVCYLKDFNNQSFNLPDFVDNESGFITMKSINGKDIKALELPGLWNGSMADWNTIFVEVPSSTFAPVKTINDLLRDEHLHDDDI